MAAGLARCFVFVATPYPTIPHSVNLPKFCRDFVEIPHRRSALRSRWTCFVASLALVLGRACDVVEPLPQVTDRSAAHHADASRGTGAAAAADPGSGGARPVGSGSDASLGAGGAGAAADARVPDVRTPLPFDGPSTAQPVAERLVAMGDLHSDIGSTHAAFRLAGAIDEAGDWIGGDMTIVQLGDVIGRSDDEREVLDFLFDIQRQAAAAGGAVHVLIGNHEVMGGRVDFQAVGPNPFPAYEDMIGLDLDDPRLQYLPDNQKKRGAALMTGGPYAKKLADFPTVLRVGDTIYVHGGVVPRWALYGLDRINWEVSRWLRGETDEPDSSRGVDNGDRVMWTRVFSSGVDAADCALLDETLKILGARRMIVAHTVHPNITPRCEDKVWAIDVGMSRAYGGPIEVLEIVEDQALSVLKE